MAHSFTGGAGAATLAGGALTIKLKGWEMELTGNTVSDRGTGESWESKIATFNDWKAMIRGNAADAAEMSITGTTADVSLIGTAIAFALKRKSGDSNPWFSGTGMVTGIKRTNPLADPSEVEVTLECSEGVAPTMDTTPA